MKSTLRDINNNEEVLKSVRNNSKDESVERHERYRNTHMTNRSGYSHNIINGCEANEYSPRLNISPREIKGKISFR